MNLKQNINRIHIELQNNFNDVKLLEGSNLKYGNYFEIECCKEDKKLVAIITKKDLDQNVFNWSYYSNPNTKDYLVERSSHIESFINDVEDIFKKNRFSSDYTK